jgi:hypothetical protein
MGIKAVYSSIQTAKGPVLYYMTDDMQRFLNLNEAVEHEVELKNKPLKETIKTTFEQVWSVQEAINKAAETKQVVRFLSCQTNAEIKKGIIDLRGCKIMKPSKEATEVAVIPPEVTDFDFEDVN